MVDPGSQRPLNPQIDDPVTARAIDDIVAHETDQSLQISDRRSTRIKFAAPKRTVWRKIGHVFRLWLGTSWGRWITFIVLLGALGAGAGIASVRYYCLNAAGVRSTASVSVVDNLLGTPLKNVQVTLGSQHTVTDSKGNAAFKELKLGPANLHISQLGFTSVSRHVIVGWGSNPFGSFALKSVGLRYTIQVRDYLTGQPIAGAEASVGQASATSDATGKMILTLPGDNSAGSVSVTKDGYRTDQFALQPPGKTTAAQLVTTQKEVYVSQEDGTYNLYKADMDGHNRQQILPGSGSETSAMSLVMSPDATHAALVSVRDTQKAADGKVLNTLTLVSVTDDSTLTLAHAETIRLIDWIGSKLIFEQVNPATGASGTSIISYDFASNSRAQLATGTNIGSVLSAQGSVYFSVSGDGTDAALPPGFYKVNPDGSGKQATVTQEVTSAVRADYATFDVNTDSGWLMYTISNDTTKPTTSPAAIGRVYVGDPGNSGISAYVADGNVLLHTVTSGKDTTISASGGATHVVAWVGTQAVIYRLATDGESADYAVGLDGGTPHKVADLLNTAGFMQGQ